MKRFCPVSIWLAAALIGGASLAQAPSAGAPPGRAALTIRADRPGARISPLLYGVFFEEINHGGDGGVYAELVRNRSFEDGESPVGWSTAAEGVTRTSMSVDRSAPFSGARCLRVEPPAAQAGPAEVVNGGYWGIAVRAGEAYRLSLRARRSPTARVALRVRLEGQTGQVYADAPLGPVSTEWKEHRTTLRPSASDGAARLVISGAGPGTFWLDQVSLFPTATWKRRKNGLRRDLAEMVGDIRPGFLRFPGGCFVEGFNLANAYRWKTTVGPVGLRPGHDPNTWGYRSTDGLGFHEYLQWCEDLGAEPLFVINCGMSCQFRGNQAVPMSQLDEWVQDALDALEYANGPRSSRWGAVRAANGHPKPFRLRLLEIGNENGWGPTLPLYGERYARFYDAIRAKRPEVKLIATTPVRSRPMDVVDEHFYESPDWFIRNTARYDTYDRKGPRIYVGEYAVTRDCGLGNLRAALAEAAWMTGLERNGDVVTMASYAPLFVNVHDRKWNPDAIGFDAARSYGTPSYYVQKLFGQNRGDVVLPLELSQTSPEVRPSGGVGLGTWRTQAEFRDARVKIDDRLPISGGAFLPGAPGWRPRRGEWKVADGVYRQSSDAEDVRSLAGEPGWRDYVYTVRARKIAGAEGFLVMFHVRDDGNWYWWNVGGWNNTQHAIEKATDGAKSMVGRPVPGRIETGRWYDLRVEVQGARIRCYLDGTLVHDVVEQGAPALAAVASRVERSGDVVLKVVNTSAAPQTVQVRLEGAGRLASTARAWVMTGKPEDQNSLEKRENVAPVGTTIQGVGLEFAHTFLPYSITVLRLRSGR
jgi:alpha-L-arabinofuranosidase